MNINSGQNCSRFSLKYALDFSFCSPSAIVLPALHNFLHRRRNITKLLSSSLRVLLFCENNYYRNSALWSFLVEYLRDKSESEGAASYKRLQRREFSAKTHTPLWLLIRRILFVAREKTSFTLLIGCITFFTSERQHFLL